MLALIYYSKHWNLPSIYNKFTLACRFWSLLFTQEIYAKDESFRISLSSTLEVDHEARQESIHVMNMTLNDSRTEVSMFKSLVTQPKNSEAWMARTQALTTKATTSMGHMQVHTNGESFVK
jgi:ornithine cyclodeaminase/alanine dehydrogenase-like protein (mu-crystallin family)